MRKKYQTNHKPGSFYKIPDQVLFKTVKVIKYKEKSEKLSQSIGT